MNRVTKFVGNISSNIWFGIKTSFLASKRYFVLKLIILLSTTLIPLLNILLWKEILNGIVNAAKDIVLTCLAIYLTLKMITYLLARFDQYVNERYYNELQFYIEGVMIEKTSRMDLSFFDSASMGDKVQHARSNFSVMSSMTWLVFDIISEIINIIATAVIVFTYKWWVGLVTILLLIPFMIYNKSTQISFYGWKRNSFGIIAGKIIIAMCFLIIPLNLKSS